MGKQFFVTHRTGEIQKGLFWGTDKPLKGNLVMQTGMGEYAGRYEDLAKYLNSYGFDVYCLDAFGQGENAKSVQDLQKWPKDAFFKNVDGIALTVELARKNNKPTYVYGHSMGSFMVQSFLERYPIKADKVIICGSNGPARLLYLAANLLASLIVNKNNWDKPSKFLTSLAMGNYAKSIKGRETELDWLSYNKENVQKYIKDPYCGVTNTNGFWREFLKGMNSLYKRKNLSKISHKERIFIIAGEDDPVGNMSKGPIALEQMYRKLGLKDVSLKIYDNMRHEIHNETEKSVVYKDLLNFLNN